MFWVVLPVFNEADAIEGVVQKWVPIFEALRVPWTFCIVDDGSTDATPSILDRLAREIPPLRIQHKKNAGHGAACRSGYDQALKENAEWIFQIDSDGQCDPAYFPPFWEAKQNHAVIFGDRVHRDDGFSRVMISWAMGILIWAVTGTRVVDANVPYRLIRADRLRIALQAMPSPAPELENAMLAVLLVQQNQVHWVPIHFRERRGGNPSTRWWGFVKKGQRLYSDLRKLSQRSHT